MVAVQVSLHAAHHRQFETLERLLGGELAQRDGGTGGFAFRHRAGNVVIFLVLIVAAAQLFSLQVPRAAGLRAQAAGQLKVTCKDLNGQTGERTADLTLA